MHRSPPPRLFSGVLLRFFCGRRGAVAARLLIVVLVPFLSAAGAGSLWLLDLAWQEFKGIRAELTAIGLFMASAREHEAAQDQRVVFLGDRLERLEIRIDRLTDRRNAGPSAP
jgi:hypothetical protein